MGYIKQITIQGFKSYKDQTQIEPFSPKSNIIVGRNGSGKSNFFAAVRFVLGDDYHNMKREERQALLHEGSGSAVMSAYVEVCFDNSEDRFSTGRPEFYLRRTIGAKKDEYSYDRKNTTKAEVQQMLESAGFSRANPYYIVPQGRVTDMTNMSDARRLDLLKEISGSTVYETRRADSLKSFSDVDNKCIQIDDTVRSINERLEELQGEKDELDAWNKNDRERRCLIYTMKHREEAQLENEIERMDQRRYNGVANIDNYRNDFLQNEHTIGEIDVEANRLKGDLRLLKDDRAQLDVDRKETNREKAKVELELTELRDGQSTTQKANRKRDSELKNVQQQISSLEAELEQLLPRYNAKKEEEQAVQSQLLEAEAHRKRLEDKQGRTAFYTNKRQRDEALRIQIEEINTDLTTRKAVLMQTNEDVTALQKSVESLENEISKLQSTIENEHDETLDFATRVQRAEDQQKKLNDERTGLYREQNKLESQLETARRQLTAAERSLSNGVSAAVGRGLATLRDLQKKHDLSGVHGTIADLLEVSDTYKTVAEVSAGDALFNVVCDTDDTATRVIKLLNQERGGRLTFIPLNQVRPNPAQVAPSSDVQPLLPKLRYDPAYEKAFKHVFGRVVICPDLSICRSIAKTHHVDAYTADGDKADTKGRYNGGWRDPTQSRIDAVRQVAECREYLEQLQERKMEIRNELATKAHELTAAASEKRRLDYQRNQVEHSYGPMRQELRSKQAELLRVKNDFASKQQTATGIEARMSELGQRQSDLETEIASDFKKALSRDEEQMLVSLAATVQDLRRQSSRLAGERAEFQSRKSEIEMDLNENLQPSLDQLLTQQSGPGGSVKQSSRLKECERLLKSKNDTLAGLGQQIQDLDEQIEQTNTRLAELESAKADKEQNNRDLARTMEREEKSMTRRMTERATYKDQLAVLQREIRDLGTLPEEHQKFTRWDTKKISDRLTKVNQAQKKFSHVNKKAFEQYESFAKARTELTNRRAELDTSRGAIERLIDHLDQRKDEAISRTFKQVSKAFQEVFAQLVPAGRGSLIIQRKSDREARRARQEEDSDDEEVPRANGNKSSVENYAGVGIAVSFNSKHDEQQRIQQLSGGQKSLCALALIFAIQQCDPAPFYLFDEIDANLDAQYRTAVAEMLKKLSGKGGESGEGGGQFICTTFRPEMVLVADKCYGVSFSNKTSSIDVVDTKAALDFVENAQKL